MDIKRGDITLSDWTKGISADEFSWGSYFYSDWIQTWYNTKWFKLWPRNYTRDLNYRKDGYAVAVCPTLWSLYSNDSRGFLAFTNDWRMETNSMNGAGDQTWADNSPWWAIYALEWSSPRFKWWIVYWDYALGIWSTGTITKIDYRYIFDRDDQSVTDPTFEDWTGWTIGTGWTLDGWAVHETGETGTLETSVTAPAGWKARVAVKISWATAGRLTIDCNWASLKTPSNSYNGWFVFNMGDITSGNSYTITITPTDTFDWVLEAVNFHVFNSSYIDTISTLGNEDNYCSLVWQWDIYFSYGNKIKALSTSDWTLGSELKLVDSNETIVSLTQQAWSLIIWTTDWQNSKQYYWDGVSSIASEVIEWKWQVIKWVVGTEIVAYVLCAAQSTADAAAFRLYSVSGYQRSLIASNSYNVEWVVSDIERYNKRKKFVFNDVDWPNSMCIYMDNLFIPWCDGVYQFWQTLPWVWNAWSRPIRYPHYASNIKIVNSWDIYVVYTDWDNNNCYIQIESNNFWDNWYLVTESIYWDKLSSRKAIEQLKIWYKSIAKKRWNIKIYAIVDDDYFWRFNVKNVSTRPKVWDVYTVAADTNAEIINIEKTDTTTGVIWFKTVKNEWSLHDANTSLTRVSGEWDATISVNRHNYDNMILVKTIETDEQEFGSDFIFWKDFVNAYLPYRHKIQLVIELNKVNSYYNQQRTPEIYEITMVADITDTTL